MERRITLASDPAGAIVLLNDVEVGRTPLTIPFEWYGDYDIRIRLDKNVGTAENPIIKHYYIHTHRKTVTPWYEFLGIDLFAELSPVTYKDEQESGRYWCQRCRKFRIRNCWSGRRNCGMRRQNRGENWGLGVFRAVGIEGAERAVGGENGPSDK